MSLFSIRDLKYLAAREAFLLIWKHKYYLPAGGNCFVLCNLTDLIGSVVFDGVKQVVVDVAGTL